MLSRAALRASSYRRAFDRDGRPSREVDGEREIRVTEAAARLRRQGDNAPSVLPRARSGRHPEQIPRESSSTASASAPCTSAATIADVASGARSGSPVRITQGHACRRVEIELVVPKLSEHVGVQASRVLDGEPLIEPSGAAV